ncbi:Dps family protein [Microbaculum sp. FT89]|uniref:Dps family protein n=1 Tax=Microbaculum sp. FT89 TaxID=3447298 RepID=UPI003F52C6F2
MTNNVELSEQSKAECATALKKVLADTFVLYLKTHNFHWNVEGPRFLGLHAKFEEQYQNLWTVTDEIAERIRALGHKAPGTFAAFTDLADVKETESPPSENEMLAQLIADNETVARTIRGALPTVQSAGDEASAGLLADRLTYHEKEVWMMKSITA